MSIQFKPTRRKATIIASLALVLLVSLALYFAAAAQTPYNGSQVEIQLNGFFFFFDRDNNLSYLNGMYAEVRREGSNDVLGTCEVADWIGGPGYFECEVIQNPFPSGVYVVWYAYQNLGGTWVMAIGDERWEENTGGQWSFPIPMDYVHKFEGPVKVYPLYSKPEENAAVHNYGQYTIPDGYVLEDAWWLLQDLVISDSWMAYQYAGGYDITVAWGPGGTGTTALNTSSTHEPVIVIHPVHSPYKHILPHEFGHLIMYRLYDNQLPPYTNCAEHRMYFQTSPSCAWIEGWANFFSLAVTNDPLFAIPGAVYDVENNTWGTPIGGENDEGDEVEGRVAGALWDIYDSVDDGYDFYTEADMFEEFIILDTWWPNDFAEYWDLLLTWGMVNTHSGQIFPIYQNTIDYRDPDPDPSVNPDDLDFGESPLVVNLQGTGGIEYTIDTRGATRQPDDPVTSCGSSHHSRSVWFSYGPAGPNDILRITTEGSFHDTVIAVWTGNYGATMAQAGCNDNYYSGVVYSELEISLIQGQTYLIEVMSKGVDSDGDFLELFIEPLQMGTDTIGTYEGGGVGRFKLRYTNTAGSPNLNFIFAAGVSNGIPITGDWDGDGVDTIGVFDPDAGEFQLRNSNSPGPADVTLSHASLIGVLPMAGDWNGNGYDTVGFYVNGRMNLRNSLTIGNPEIKFNFGSAGLTPLAGDWNGNGIDTIGTFDPVIGEFQLRNSNSAGPADITITHAQLVGKLPLTGDWDGDGDDTLGVYDNTNGHVNMRNTNNYGPADISFFYGGAGLVPITGDWDGG